MTEDDLAIRLRIDELTYSLLQPASENGACDPTQHLIVYPPPPFFGCAITLDVIDVAKTLARDLSRLKVLDGRGQDHAEKVGKFGEAAVPTTSYRFQG